LVVVRWLPGQGIESLLNTNVGLGTGLEELDAKLISQSLALVLLDNLNSDRTKKYVSLISDECISNLLLSKEQDISLRRLLSYLLVEHVALVSDQDLVDTFTGMLFHVGEPVANV